MQHFTLARPEVVAEQVSVDGTRKWLLRLPGEVRGRAAARGRVRLHPGDRPRHLCVSSQVGCTLTCSFCHTGTQRLVRNLTPGEIVGQVMVARDRLGDFIGMERAQGAGPADRRRALHLQHRDDGDGRAALQFRGGARRARRGAGRRRPGISQAPHHAVDLRRGADDRARRRRDRRHAGDLAARGARRTAQRAGAAQSQISDRRTARGLPQLSRRLERAAHHLRIRDAQGRQRFARRRQGAGAAAQGHSGQDQSHSVQSLARQPVRMLGLGADREVLRDRVQRRLCLAGAHAARPRHPRRLRPAQERDRKASRPRAHGAARHGDDGLQ